MGSGQNIIYNFFCYVLSFETMLFISKKFGMCKCVKWKIVLWFYFGVLSVYFFFPRFCFRGRGGCWTRISSWNDFLFHSLIFCGGDVIVGS